MIKKDITFEDFDGNSVTETHYFHLTKQELLSLEMNEDGGLGTKLEEVIKSGNGAEIIKTFRWIVGEAYGQRDPANPVKFFKSKKLTEDFLGSLAFDKLFSELMSDEMACAEFVNGIVPKDLASTPEMIQAMTDAGLPAPRTLTDVKLDSVSIGPIPDSASGLSSPRDHKGELLPWAFRHPTDKELTTMTRPQLLEAMRRKSSSTWKPPEGLNANPSQ